MHTLSVKVAILCWGYRVFQFGAEGCFLSFLSIFVTFRPLGGGFGGVPTLTEGVKNDDKMTRFVTFTHHCSLRGPPKIDFKSLNVYLFAQNPVISLKKRSFFANSYRVFLAFFEKTRKCWERFTF